MIELGQIYEAADLRDEGRRIRITGYLPGWRTARIVSHPSGKNFRQLNVKDLHADRNTGKGIPRRTGYFLVGMYEEGSATAGP